MATKEQALKEEGFMRQVQRGRFSLRLKVVGGNLTAGQVAVIARVAETYGEGKVHLTSRQGVEIPFIRRRDIEAVKAELAAGGVCTGVCGPAVRTVTACQGSGVCPRGNMETYDLARELSLRYDGRRLPHKFKIGVTGCMNNCLKAEQNDMGFKGGQVVEWAEQACNLCGACVKACRAGALGREEGGCIHIDREKCIHCGRCVKTCRTGALRGTPGAVVYFGGLFGNSIATGRQLLPIITDRDALLRVADAAVEFFCSHAAPGERFNFTAGRVGWDKLEEAVGAAFQGLAEDSPAVHSEGEK